MTAKPAKPNYQAIEVALSNEINRFDALIEARDTLRNIASLEQAAQETQARIDKLRDDEKAIRAKIAALDAEFAKKRAEVQAECDRMRAEARRSWTMPTLRQRESFRRRRPEQTSSSPMPRPSSIRSKSAGANSPKQFVGYPPIPITDRRLLCSRSWYGRSLCFETRPSRPNLQACRALPAAARDWSYEGAAAGFANHRPRAPEYRRHRAGPRRHASESAAR
jgi:hypothetical protein